MVIDKDNTYVVTAGDSFAFGHNNFFMYIQDSCNSCINVSRPGVANRFIKHRIQYGILDILNKGVQSDNIFVGITWSGINRVSLVDVEKYGDEDYSQKRYMQPQPIDYLADEFMFGKEDSDILWSNFSIGHTDFDPAMKYFGNFYSRYDGIIGLLECIIDTQRFLENYGIKYMMTTSWNIFKYDYEDWFERRPGEQNDYYIGGYDTFQYKHCFNYLRPNKLYNYLVDQINFTKFLDIEGIWEYCYEINPQRNHKIDHHPNKDEIKTLTDNIIKPFIEKL